jgi:hypothetical protein
VTGDHELLDARESLRDWERRERELPRRARRRRHEARLHAERWRERVADQERDVYGPGLVGALTLLVHEGRLPEPVRHHGRRMALNGRRAMVLAGAMVATGLLLVTVLCVTALLMMFGVL